MTPRFAYPSVFMFVALTGWPAASRTEARAPNSQSQIIDVAIDAFRRANPRAATVSIGVVQEGRTSTHHSGTAGTPASGIPDADSIYPIASITKTFTGTLLAQAVIDRKVTLEDDVRKYLPGSYPNLEFEGRPIQLAHLVNHVSGLPFNLPDIAENRPPFPKPVAPAVRDRLAKYDRPAFFADLRQVTLVSAPGSVPPKYSNAGAVLLSLVLERIHDRPFNDIVSRQIAVPLGMRDTTISLSPGQRSRVLTGHSPEGRVEAGEEGLLLGAGALKSTTRDLLKYVQWQIDESDPAVKLSHVPTFTAGNYSMGLNWQTVQAGNYRRIWQEGTIPGFSCVAVAFPELKLGLIVLTNQEDPESSAALSQLVRQIASGLEPRSTPLF